jgi:hypothetical protein
MPILTPKVIQNADPDTTYETRRQPSEYIS